MTAVHAACHMHRRPHLSAHTSCSCAALSWLPVLRLPNGTAECIDAREPAPAASNETMYIGEVPPGALGCCCLLLPLLPDRTVRVGCDCEAAWGLV